ncbi:MAG: hypothetical protein ACREMY_19710 [bacterium]
MAPKYPGIQVRLTGGGQHPMFIMGRSVAAMRRAGLSEADRQAFISEATAGNYDSLLATVRRWFNVN